MAVASKVKNSLGRSSYIKLFSNWTVSSPTSKISNPRMLIPSQRRIHHKDHPIPSKLLRRRVYQPNNHPPRNRRRIQPWPHDRWSRPLPDPKHSSRRVTTRIEHRRLQMQRRRSPRGEPAEHIPQPDGRHPNSRGWTRSAGQGFARYVFDDAADDVDSVADAVFGV